MIENIQPFSVVFYLVPSIAQKMQYEDKDFNTLVHQKLPYRFSR